MRHMMTLTDVHGRLQQIDKQLVDLIEERARLCHGQEIDPDDEEEMVSMMLEEAADRGLDEVIVDKWSRLLMRLCRTRER